MVQPTSAIMVKRSTNFFNLSHKALLLVMLPLTCDIILLVMLFNLVLSAEQLAARTEHVRWIRAQADAIFEHVGEAAVSLAGASNLSIIRGYEGLVTQVKQDLADLVTASNKTEDLAAAVQIQATTQRILGVLDEDRIRKENDSIEYPLGYNNTRRQLTDLLKILEESIERAYPAEQRADLERETVASGQMIKIIIIVGFIGNVILALSLTVYFNRGTTRRLQALMKNINSLAEGKELAPPIGGRDEIAQLDSTFHDMADLLAQAQRSRQEVMQMVSHDLKSPLFSIQLVLDMMLSGKVGQLDDKGEKLACAARRSASRMLALINDLLEIEKMEAGMLELDKSDISLSSVFEQSIQSVTALANEKGVELQSVETNLNLYADSNRLVQVLVNLLSNAVKFSDRGSKVIVAAQQVAEWVEIKVSDQGRGISADSSKFIFDRFHQIRAEDAKNLHGTGLGLSICKALVELHGGDIRVESEEGKGTTFLFRIPARGKVVLPESADGTDVVPIDHKGAPGQ